MEKMTLQIFFLGHLTQMVMLSYSHHLSICCRHKLSHFNQLLWNSWTIFIHQTFFFRSYVMALCGDHFREIHLLLVEWFFWILSTIILGWYWFGVLLPLISKQKIIMCKNWYFCYLYMESNSHLILMVIFFFLWIP